MLLPQKRHAIVEPILELNRIRVRDNGEPLVNALEALDGLAVHEGRWEPDQHPFRFYGRARVVEMLRLAQAALPRGHRLLLWGIYRSLDEQREIYERVYQRFQREHPAWPKNILRRQTNRFVHPPDIKTPPGHSTGGAVDLSVQGPDGRPLDMTSPFDPEAEDRRQVADTFSPLLDEVARRNREILLRAMSEVGFTNYGGEWWHWSYGDSCWAWRTRRRVALYGPTSPSLTRSRATPAG